jgi:hypothetical protein
MSKLTTLTISVAILALGTTPALYAEADDDAAERLYRETVNLPPAANNPRDDFLARTTGFRVAVGAYTSIQANVDELGLNIVGDSTASSPISVRAGTRTRSTAARAGRFPACSPPEPSVRTPCSISTRRATSTTTA